MSESQFQASVTELAQWSGWSVMHVAPVTDRHGRTRTATSTSGWPDLTMWKPDRFLMAELKSERGRLTAEQKAVLDSLTAAGVDVRVWRPSDWPEVVATLNPKRTPTPAVQPEVSFK